MPYPSLLHPVPLPLQQTTAGCTSTGDGQIQFCLSLCGVPGSWCTWICLSPLSISGRYGFDSKHYFAPPTFLLGLFLCPWMWGISSQPLQRLPSYWGFTDLGRGVSPHSWSSEARLPLLTFDMGYLICLICFPSQRS